MRAEGRPLIFNLHHFALDDGPGIRTTVFMKGCPLSCAWCHNPESVSPEPEIAFYGHLCIGCGSCMDVCPEGAVSMRPGRDRITRERCTACGTCSNECPSTALRTVGAYYQVDTLVERLLKERIFYDTSGGGVTFSGGEPAIFMDYVGTVMKRLKAEGIHVAIQTSGMFNLQEFGRKLLPYIDLIFFDLKLIDSDMHRKFTGRGNNLILENFRYLADNSPVPVVPRIPLIPGITATGENLSGLADFLRYSGFTSATLLPYNPGAISKAAALGKALHPTLPNRMIPAGEEEALTTFFRQRLSGHAKEAPLSEDIGAVEYLKQSKKHKEVFSDECLEHPCCSPHPGIGRGGLLIVPLHACNRSLRRDCSRNIS
ncbi:MAG: glycyl-radical enzyme activating protein [Nitrospirae bacterium]|nr:glycyl-radical enzyme activating protein [Nitrospirota bacterium]